MLNFNDSRVAASMYLAPPTPSILNESVFVAERMSSGNADANGGSEHVDLNALFERMTAQELEVYAQNGTLPAWFTGAVGATASDSQKE